jgi:hypothetical protein
MSPFKSIFLSLGMIPTILRLSPAEKTAVVHPEVEYCTYNLNIRYGETFNIRNYVHVKQGGSPSEVDWSQVSFTYTAAGANDPTSPTDWNLTNFNAGTSVTVSATDNEAGDGNHGQGEYRIYVVRNGVANFDDHMTIRVQNSTSDQSTAQCDGWVQGRLYKDLNNNGVYDAGTDTPYSNVNVTITFSDGSSTTQTTDASGHYQAEGRPGACTVNPVSPSGVTLQAGYTDPITVTVPASGQVTQDFPYFSSPVGNCPPLCFPVTTVKN